jgi:hypothetical protein
MTLQLEEIELDIRHPDDIWTIWEKINNNLELIESEINTIEIQPIQVIDGGWL